MVIATLFLLTTVHVVAAPTTQANISHHEIILPTTYVDEKKSDQVTVAIIPEREKIILTHCYLCSERKTSTVSQKKPGLFKPG